MLDSLTKGALSVHPRARVIDVDDGPEARAKATYWETSADTNLGSIHMPATLTVLYAGFDGRKHEKRFIELFENHDFRVGHDGSDLDAAVYANDELHCRTWLTHDDAWLRCVPSDYLEFVELEVADPVTRLYIKSTGDVGMSCWRVSHVVAHEEPSPTGAILHVGLCDDREAWHFYVDGGGGWKEIPESRVCGAEYRLLFEGICLAASLAGLGT